MDINLDDAFKLDPNKKWGDIQMDEDDVMEEKKGPTKKEATSANASTKSQANASAKAKSQPQSEDDIIDEILKDLNKVRDLNSTLIREHSVSGKEKYENLDQRLNSVESKVLYWNTMTEEERKKSTKNMIFYDVKLNKSSKYTYIQS